MLGAAVLGAAVLGATEDDGSDGHDAAPYWAAREGFVWAAPCWARSRCACCSLRTAADCDRRRRAAAASTSLWRSYDVQSAARPPGVYAACRCVQLCSASCKWRPPISAPPRLGRRERTSRVHASSWALDTARARGCMRKSSCSPPTSAHDDASDSWWDPAKLAKLGRGCPRRRGPDSRRTYSDHTCASRSNGRGMASLAPAATRV